MNVMIKNVGTVVLLTALLVGLPLVGIVPAGKDVGSYMEFPPLTRYVEHADFSWPLFVGMAILVCLVVLPFAVRMFLHFFRAGTEEAAPHPFPWFGRLGLFGGIVAWVLAWTRFEWFAPLQRFTFSPLWFSYILVVNAFTYQRTGRCMLRNRPGCLVLLFLLSAAFWWFFEYLNRFVQNWYYVGIGGITKLEYFIFATLPFSTVLPAVLGTYELLESFPRIGAGLNHFMRFDIRHSRLIAGIMLVLASVGLAGIGVWPDWLFPLLWVSPLVIICAIRTLLGQNTVFTSIRFGYWRRIVLLAGSALICGFFWEMWNYLSMAKWIYTVPFVGRFKLFEMPILGYAGYLPFGLECAVVADLVGWSFSFDPVLCIEEFFVAISRRISAGTGRVDRYLRGKHLSCSSCLPRRSPFREGRLAKAGSSCPRKKEPRNTERRIRCESN